MTALHAPFRYSASFCVRIMSCIKPVKDQLKHKIGKFTYHVIPKTRNDEAEDELFSINPFSVNVHFTKYEVFH